MGRRQDQFPSSITIIWNVVWIGIATATVKGQVVIDQDTVINADNSYPNAGIEVVSQDGLPTRVTIIDGGEVATVSQSASALRGASVLNVVEGIIWKINTYDTSTLNVMGGQVGSFRNDDSASNIVAFGHSTVNVSGGMIRGSELRAAISARENSMVIISGGDIVGDDATVGVHDDAILYVTGGVILDDEDGPAIAGDGGTIHISGGMIVNQVSVSPRARLNMLDGEIMGRLSVNGAVNIIGGTVNGPTNGTGELALFDGTITDGVRVNALGTASVFGGVVGGPVDALGSVAIYGGTFQERIAARSGGSVRISGGQIQSILVDESSLVEVHGSDIVLRGGQLSGRLADGSLIDAAVDTIADGQVVISTAPAQLGDFSFDGELSSEDIDMLAMFSRVPNAKSNTFDVTLDGVIDLADHVHWVHHLRETWFGDANLDGMFNQDDIVDVLEAGEFGDGVPMNSSWATGDWNGDTEFDQLDLVLALQDNGFGKGSRSQNRVVPEPQSIIAMIICCLELAVAFSVVSRRNRPHCH